MKSEEVVIKFDDEVKQTAKASDTAAIIAGLKQVLADLHVLTALTHDAHWNVEGFNFIALHKEFGDEYDAAFEETDTIAERIRRLGQYVEVDLAEFKSTAGIAVPVAPIGDKEWVAAVLAGQEKVVADLKVLEVVSGWDLSTQNLATTLIDGHTKTVWFLRSLLK